MSRKTPNAALKYHSEVFAALGDKTRLSLIRELSRGEAKSISQLSRGSKLTRQAVTKHLKVLEEAGLVESAKSGRENLFHLQSQPLEEAQELLNEFSRQWDQALHRLKSFVEEN